MISCLNDKNVPEINVFVRQLIIYAQPGNEDGYR